MYSINLIGKINIVCSSKDTWEVFEKKSRGMIYDVHSRSCLTRNFNINPRIRTGFQKAYPVTDWKNIS